MADTATPRKRLTVREFLEWEEKQPRKYELHGGLIRFMAGGTKGRNTIKGNIFSALRARLRGKPCQVFDSDLKVRTEGGGVYYPDVTIDCGDRDAAATEASLPTIVFEVLSKSTRSDDLEGKLPSYQATPSIRQIVYVEANLMHLMVWRRIESGWEEIEIVHPDQSLVLDSVGVELSFAEIYEDVDFAS